MEDFLDTISIVIISGNAVIFLLGIKYIVFDCIFGSEKKDDDPEDGMLIFIVFLLGVISVLSVFYLIFRVAAKLQ